MGTTRSNAVRKPANVASFSNVSARRFGQSVGRGDARDVAESDALHRQWKGSEKKEQGLIRKNFFIGYIMGRCEVDEVKAEGIFKAARTAVTREQGLAKMAASQKFLYLVARNGSKAKGKARASNGKAKVSVRVTDDMRKAADKFLVTMPGRTLADQVAKAKAALDAILKAANAAASDDEAE